MTIMRVLDGSAWTKEIAPSVWPALRSAGIRMYIPQIHGSGPDGGGLNPYLRQHVAGALAADIIVPTGYTWPSWKWPESVAYWKQELAMPLRGIWLDVEAGAGVHPDQIDDIRARGIVPGIYASRHSWSSIMGADTQFADVPLWAAHYRAGPWPEAMQEGDKPYVPNSWPRELVVGWQWMGTTTLQDEQFDLNVFSEEFVQGLYKDAPPVEEDLTVEQYEELSGRIKSLNERVAANARDIATLQKAPTPAPAPPPPAPTPPSRQYVMVASGDRAGNWFTSEGNLLALNPNFPRVAYTREGHVLRRFAPDRDWNFIVPDERLWTT